MTLLDALSDGLDCVTCCDLELHPKTSASLLGYALEPVKSKLIRIICTCSARIISPPALTLSNSTSSERLT
jgi:hypothetical protein